MKRVLSFSITLITIFMGIKAKAQESSNRKVVLITLDGLRWQELFTGADPLLIANKKYVRDTTELKNRFWRDSPKERREVLFPFLWKEVAQIGQIHGNRNLGSKVDLKNKMWFSYPGYNEILSGKADDTNIDSNDKINNKNITILELANQDPRYKDKVAAFASWDVFPYIINEERSGVPVNAGFELAEGEDLSVREQFLNELQPTVPSPWSTVRLDAFTHQYAMEHIKKNHPELVYIAYGETDDFAHEGHYDAYLKSANTTDAFIKELWDFTQKDSFYKDNTVLIISTDHGRGALDIKSWTGHGDKVKDAGGVWLILFGSGVEPLGEISKEEQLYSNQIAPTIAKILDLTMEKGAMGGKSLKAFKN
ncbi:phosphoglyceromutase [Maribacter algarum]|uniref:Phosphoglyceromutase n=1 Tax=Maribacter algarum (ex Zhang et al. 2020) TaxID=2578118 RepID=A0A5S3PXT6_9FLAO|nr:alkaline phosphatase family protein [Maribacter algarum]TMM59062.1 phosphoglyceromutase [Maribacter algarum]